MLLVGVLLVNIKGTEVLLNYSSRKTDFSLKDEQGTVTIGFNNQYNDGEDKWCWAGWCWSHDYIRESNDKPTHFMEFDDTPPEIVVPSGPTDWMPLPKLPEQIK